jgi:hypothetical protein
MNEIRKLWEEVKNLLHAPTMTQPLWQSVIDKMHEFEARIAALESHPAVSIPPLAPVAAQAEVIQPTGDMKLPEEQKPTEQVIHPDAPVIGPSGEKEQPAAEGAADSGGTGDAAASPSVNTSPEKAAGPNEGDQEHHDGGHEGHE